jgi:hypothetical protein
MSRLVAIFFALAFLAFSTPAFSQATRTWVSGVGDDVNPCSRTAPCKTFAGAISKTLAGGEINCLDPGGFGAVTITKSITIDCTGTLGSVLNTGTTGILINDSATASPNSIDVILRGIDINGAGTSPGINGVRFFSGRSLVLQDVFIQNERGGNGILVEPGGTSRFEADNVTVTGGAGGIRFQPRGASGILRAVLRNVRSENNSAAGLRIDSSGNTSTVGTLALIDRSSFSGNGDGIIISTVGGTQAIAMVTDTLIGANTNAGLSATGTSARMLVAKTSITSNGTGVVIGTNGVINTYGDNRLIANTTNGAFTTPIIPQQ